MTRPSQVDVARADFATAARPLVFSGHESFACRYGWLPKVYEATLEDPLLFESPEKAILRLGIGRNMVKSIRFWAESFGLVQSGRGPLRLTSFAHRLLDVNSGFDPYLETHGALWRLHWMLTFHARLGAWAVAFLETRDREVAREEFIASVAARAADIRGALTPRTAANHVDIFLRTYTAPRRINRAAEDALASPFQELDLLDSRSRAGQTVIFFSRGPKSTLDPSAFAVALQDFWRRTAPSSSAVPLRSLMLSYCAPGPVFLLDEVALHDKLAASISRRAPPRRRSVRGSETSPGAASETTLSLPTCGVLLLLKP